METPLTYVVFEKDGEELDGHAAGQAHGAVRDGQDGRNHGGPQAAPPARPVDHTQVRASAKTQ
jgi:hypothetical protein